MDLLEQIKTITEVMKNITMTLANLPAALVVISIMFFLVWKFMKRFYKTTINFIAKPKVRKGLIIAASGIAAIIWLVFLSVTSAQKEWGVSTTIPFALFMTSAVFLMITMLIDVFVQSNRRRKYIAMYTLISLSFVFIIAYDVLVQRNLWEKIVNPVISAGVGGLVSWLWFKKKLKRKHGI